MTGRTRQRRVRRWVARVLLGLTASYCGPAILERYLPRPALRGFQRHFANPGGRLMSTLPGWAILETTGRRTGQSRQVPVGGRVIGDNFWLVAVDPDHADYVRNIEANHHVRVRVRGQWRTGVAHPVPEDNARRRMFRLNPLNGLYITIVGRNYLTVRVQLNG